KGIELKDAGVFWGFKLPQMSNAQHLEALGRFVRQEGIQVIVVDPLYLCLLAGAGAAGLSGANVYPTGPLFAAVAEAALPRACRPALVHHFKTTRAAPYAEPSLEDLAYSGVKEFARQWILFGRREAYDAETGLHKLWLVTGGSAGHGGVWAVDVHEGRLND